MELYMKCLLKTGNTQKAHQKCPGTSVGVQACVCVKRPAALAARPCPSRAAELSLLCPWVDSGWKWDELVLCHSGSPEEHVADAYITLGNIQQWILLGSILSYRAVTFRWVRCGFAWSWAEWFQRALLESTAPRLGQEGPHRSGQPEHDLSCSLTHLFVTWMLTETEEGEGKDFKERSAWPQIFFLKMCLHVLNSHSCLCKLWIKGRMLRGITGASSRRDKQNV